MWMRRVLLLAVALTLWPVDGVGGEKHIVDVKELAGSWQGWVTRDEGQDRATLVVSADGSYRALTARGAITEGKFYLRDGELRYRSSRTTGAARVFEDEGKMTLTVMPAEPRYHTGRAEYERIK